jgi:hypothetical protein
MDLQSPTLFFPFSGQGKFYSYMGYDSSKYVDEIMRFSRVVRVNAEVATVPGSIPASCETVESEGRKMKQWRIQHIKKNPPPPLKKTRGRRLEQRP